VQPEDPRPPVQPEDPRPPVQPDDPRPPVQPEQPRICVDCVPATCVLTDTAVLAGCAGAVAALAACLAVAGLYVVLRYLAPYLFIASLILLLAASVYLFIRRPEDASRLRRFLAERGREAIGRLWGWAVQRPEVCTCWFSTRPAIKIFLKPNYYLQALLFPYLKTYSILLR
jgi:hypothetical protein